MESTKTNKIPDVLTPKDAITLLIQGVQMAQAKGVFTLEDAEVLAKAVRVFVKKEEPAPTPELAEVAEPTA